MTAQLRAEVTGTALPNFVANQTMAAGDLKINGVEIGAVDFVKVPSGDSEVANNAALTNIRALASAINRESDETGVWATYEPEIDDNGASYDYNLVLTSTEANGKAISLDATVATSTQTGLVSADYYPGASGDGLNNVDSVAGGVGGDVYNSNNGAVTLVSDDGFSLQENSAGVLSGT